MDIRKDSRTNGAVYALATIGTIVADLSGRHQLEYICKPLMMLVLSSWFFFSSRRVGDRFTLLVQAGLFFSLVGDVALMFQYKDEFNFLIGLGAFMIAQLCYAMAFAHNVFDIGDLEGVLFSSALALLFVLYAVLFCWDLMPRLGDGLMLPVLSQMGAISLMAISAAFRWKRTYPMSFWLVLAGAALFVTSGSVLASDRFIRPHAWSSVAITLTYALAQFLIAAGSLLHVLDPANIRRRQALST
ncbi:MAG: lysoplasmalogenase [Flavobacteriales bacterium]